MSSYTEVSYCQSRMMTTEISVHPRGMNINVWLLPIVICAHVSTEGHGSVMNGSRSNRTDLPHQPITALHFTSLAYWPCPHATTYFDRSFIVVDRQFIAVNFDCCAARARSVLLSQLLLSQFFCWQGAFLMREIFGRRSIQVQSAQCVDIYRYIIPCMLPSGHKLCTSSEYCWNWNKIEINPSVFSLVNSAVDVTLPAFAAERRTLLYVLWNSYTVLLSQLLAYSFMRVFLNIRPFSGQQPLLTPFRPFLASMCA